MTADVNARTRRYLISMSIRTICFVVAIVASGWLRWVAMFAAVTLPYLSVVIANAGRERTDEEAAPFVLPSRLALDPAPPARTEEDDATRAGASPRGTRVPPPRGAPPE